MKKILIFLSLKIKYFDISKDQLKNLVKSRLKSNKWKNKYYFFTIVIGIPAGIARASFTLIFSLTT